MGIEIRKIISRSTGTKTIQPLFWFYKRSYSAIKIKCIFSDPLNQDGKITESSVIILDKDGIIVTQSASGDIELLPNEQAVSFILKDGLVENSPYQCFCRVATDLSEQSELEFEMRISADSITSEVTFDGQPVTFGGEPVTFGGA